MTWQQHVGYMAKKTAPRISIKPKGFGIMLPIVKEYGLEKYPYVQIFFDSDSKSIGFFFRPQQEYRAFSCHTRANQKISGITIASSTFFAEHGLDQAKLDGLYPAHKEQPPFKGPGVFLTVRLSEKQ